MDDIDGVVLEEDVMHCLKLVPMLSNLSMFGVLVVLVLLLHLFALSESTTNNNTLDLILFFKFSNN
jgi:hypothetical protein